MCGANEGKHMATIDASMIAAIAGAGGVVAAKLLDVGLERFRVRHADKLDQRSAMSQASAQLFEQQNAAITDLRKDLKDTQDRERAYREENATLREKVTDLEADVRRLPRLERDLNQMRQENERMAETMRKMEQTLRDLGVTLPGEQGGTPR
jgi:predicted RNase H-like nuclease (RuvC/YqgF family)